MGLREGDAARGATTTPPTHPFKWPAALQTRGSVHLAGQEVIVAATNPRRFPRALPRRAYSTEAHSVGRNGSFLVFAKEMKIHSRESLVDALRPYRTSATATLEREPLTALSGDAFSKLLQAKSITTLVNWSIATKITSSLEKNVSELNTKPHDRHRTVLRASRWRAFSMAIAGLSLALLEACGGGGTSTSASGSNTPTATAATPIAPITPTDAAAPAPSITPAATVTPPGQPTGLTATAGNAQLNVSWTVVTGATSYNIYRSSSQGSMGSKIASGPNTDFADTSVIDGTTYYYYEVTAVNAAGESPASTQSAAATLNASVAVPAVPAVPTSVNATRGIAEVSVTWTAAAGATWYNIFRSTIQRSQGTKIGSISDTSYADSAALNGTTYYYMVTAANADGECSPSAQVAANPSTGWTTVKMGGGGYVPGVIYHPTVPNLRYARTDIAGVYRWDNGILKWTALTDGFGRLDGSHEGAESMAVDPTDASKLYMTTSMTVSNGNGRFYYSSDQGSTWNYVTLPFPVGSNNQGRAIGERLMVDPNVATTMFYASRTAGLEKHEQRDELEPSHIAFFVCNDGDRHGHRQWGKSHRGRVRRIRCHGADHRLHAHGKSDPGDLRGDPPDYKSLAGLCSYLYKSTNGGASWSPGHDSHRCHGCHRGKPNSYSAPGPGR